jgi:predicted nucleic acid-binding protein
MRFVVDTNVIISALIKDSTRRRILFHPHFEFFTPEFVFVEIENNIHEIIEKTGYTQDEFHKMFDEIISNVNVVPKDDFSIYLTEATEIMKQIDEDDTSFLALALSFKNDGIWSDDEHFQKQKLVQAKKTKDMVVLLQGYITKSG